MRWKEANLILFNPYWYECCWFHHSWYKGDLILPHYFWDWWGARAIQNNLTVDNPGINSIDWEKYYNYTLLLLYQYNYFLLSKYCHLSLYTWMLDLEASLHYQITTSFLVTMLELECYFHCLTSFLNFQLGCWIYGVFLHYQVTSLLPN